MWNGKKARLIGQEIWLPEWVHSKFRYINDNPGVTIIRHFPDVDTGRSLVQVKAAPDCTGYDYVTIETASFETSRELNSLGVPVLVVWEYPDKKFYGNWVNELVVNDPITPREETNGSHTPFKKVDKSCLKPAGEFLSYL